MYIEFKRENMRYTKKTYNREKNVFVLTSESCDEIQFSTILELDDEYNPEEYSCTLLHNTRPDVGENSIYQVYDKKHDIRIGWIFPIQALISDSHDFARDPYFLKYAYVAINLLLDKINYVYEEFVPDEFSLELYYDTQIMVLVLSDDNCEKIKDFNLDNYVISLFNYGYTFSGEGNLALDVIQPKRRVNLDVLSEYIGDKVFIIEAFKTIINEKNLNEIVMFHTLYQIIEILIGEIFSIKFLNFNNNLNASTANLFDMKDELSKIIGEKYRVKELFSTYSIIEYNKKQRLLSACNEILSDAKKNTKEVAEESLYSIRCLVFHEYRSIPENSRVKVKLLNDCLLDALIDILLTYHN